MAFFSKFWENKKVSRGGASGFAFGKHYTNNDYALNVLQKPRSINDNFFFWGGGGGGRKILVCPNYPRYATAGPWP